MTYGEFAWKDLMDAAVRDRRRTPAAGAVFIEGDLVPFMGIRERDWMYRVKRAVGRVLSRPRLQFVLSDQVHAGHRSGIDDLCKPVLDAIASRPVSVWAQFSEGPSPGLSVTELGPPYPPRIDRGIALAYTPDRKRSSEAAQEMTLVPPLAGHGPVGAHITLDRIDLGDFGYGSPVRVLLDLQSPVLDGTMARPGDTRIRDLRVVRDHTRLGGAVVRLWTID